MSLSMRLLGGEELRTLYLINNFPYRVALRKP